MNQDYGYYGEEEGNLVDTETAERVRQRILVADDEPLLRDIVREILESEGYEVDEAANGEMALESMLAKPYDLVILDLRMPRMNGFDVLQALDLEGTIEDLPVIILTGDPAPEFMHTTYRMGASYFVSKPVKMRRLVAAVRVLLNPATAAAADELRM